jgi:drug/metabolite transporter (DMT)-like permease
MSELVDTLGLLAGALWLCSAIYFQLVRERRVPAAYIIGQLLVGIALVAISSAVALEGRPTTVAMLGVIGYLLFMGLAVGVWWWLETRVESETVSDHETDGRVRS